MPESAILLQRPGSTWQRQAAACASYLAEWGYTLVGKVDSHADAFALVMNGAATVVVVASPADDDWRLEATLAQVGGRLEQARPSGPRSNRSHAAHGHGTDEIVARMASHGATTGEIVRLWGLAEDRVRAIVDQVRRRR